MGRLIEDAKEMEGKHIKSVMEIDDTGLAILFGDGDYTVIKALRGWDERISVELDEPKSDEVRVFFGLMSQEEVDKKRAQQKAAAESWARQDEYLEYLKLKKKFDGIVQP